MDARTRGYSRAQLSAYLNDRPRDGVAEIERAIFTDPELFEREMEKIWEGNWLYLAHESQLPNPHDFVTLTMGRTPVVLVRKADHQLAAYINVCTHRGAVLVRQDHGNRADFTCGFHGWCFNTEGELAKVWAEETGDYPDNFDRRDLYLRPVAKLDSYRGFIFASLNSDVQDLLSHLGGAATMIDIMADQSEQGLEVLKGYSTYTFDGNWKMQAENGVDGYHGYATHGNLMMTTAHRMQLRGEGDKIKAMRMSGVGAKSGFFEFSNGHCVVWSDWPDLSNKPDPNARERYLALYGEEKATWMFNRLRNLLLYPNVLLMDQMSTQIRTFRPLSVDKTEVTIYAIAPKGETPEARARRLRQYEDFFNASGLATPDDISEFSQCQRGFLAKGPNRNQMTRGMGRLSFGQNPEAKKLGMTTLSWGENWEDEGIFTGQHRHWIDVMAN